MNFEQAVELARRIPEVLPGARVLALGFFVPVDELRDDMPWRVSVNAPDWARPRVLNGPEDLQALLPKPTPAPTPKTTKATTQNLTPMLFD